MAATAAATLLVAAGAYPLERVAYEYLPFLPLMMLPEGFLNGMLVAILAGFRPHWLCSFDERRYLVGK